MDLPEQLSFDQCIVRVRGFLIHLQGGLYLHSPIESRRPSRAGGMDDRAVTVNVWTSVCE